MSQPQTKPIAPASAEKLTEYVAVTGAAMHKAAALEKAVEKQAADVEAILPQVLDVLEQFGRINANERDKTAKALRNPAEALRFLAKVAGHRNADEMSVLGKAAGLVPANDGNPPSNGPGNVTGGRGGPMKKSDHTWFNRMQVPLGGA